MFFPYTEVALFTADDKPLLSSLASGSIDAYINGYDAGLTWPNTDGPKSGKSWFQVLTAYGEWHVGVDPFATRQETGSLFKFWRRGWDDGNKEKIT